MRPKPEGYANKRIAVLGLGRSGTSAGRVLARLGAKLVAFDERPAEDLAEVLQANADWLETTRLGPGCLDYVQDFDAVIVSPGLALARPELQRILSSGVPVWSELELAWQLAKAPMVAVTGTNGKSTTVTLVHLALEKSGRAARLAGNIGKPVVEDALLAGPDEVLVVEVSNYQLEAVEEFHPKWAALLNLQGDHAERQPFEEYVRIKQRIFACQEPSDWAVLNFDDERVRALAPSLAPQVAAFSLQPLDHRPAAWLEGEELILDVGEGPERICGLAELNLPGLHNVQNALAAALLARLAGASLKGIRTALTTFQGLDYALKVSARLAGRTFINDSKGTNCASTLAALAAVPDPVVMIAGGKGKGADFTELGKAIAARNIKVVLLGESAGAIEDAVLAAQGPAPVRVQSLAEAVEKAFALAEPGTTILFSPACASQDMFRDYRQRGELFDQAVAALAEREAKSR